MDGRETRQRLASRESEGGREGAVPTVSGSIRTRPISFTAGEDYERRERK